MTPKPDGLKTLGNIPTGLLTRVKKATRLKLDILLINPKDSMPIEFENAQLLLNWLSRFLELLMVDSSNYTNFLQSSHILFNPLHLQESHNFTFGELLWFLFFIFFSSI
jgi:hypothetical protein